MGSDTESRQAGGQEPFLETEKEKEMGASSSTGPEGGTGEKVRSQASMWLCKHETPLRPREYGPNVSFVPKFIPFSGILRISPRMGTAPNRRVSVAKWWSGQ